MLTKEYRTCMPLTVEEHSMVKFSVSAKENTSKNFDNATETISYHIGQLYMIARHSHEQTDAGEGVQVVVNEPCEDPEHGCGQFTEKRIFLSSRLPGWVQSLIPNIFYVTEKAWNYYPYTLTEYTCSFLPKFSVVIKTKFEDNNGSSENCLNLEPDVLSSRTVDLIDIVFDELSPRHYKEAEDLKYFKSAKTGRGPFTKSWQDEVNPIMCSYKVVQVSFEVWGFQTKVEDLVHRLVREVLLLGHRQAVAWVDEWHGMTLDDVRNYEKEMQLITNTKMQKPQPTNHTEDTATSSEPFEKSLVESPKSPKAKSWFSWS